MLLDSPVGWSLIRLGLALQNEARALSRPGIWWDTLSSRADHSRRVLDWLLTPEREPLAVYAADVSELRDAFAAHDAAVSACDREYGVAFHELCEVPRLLELLPSVKVWSKEHGRIETFDRTRSIASAILRHSAKSRLPPKDECRAIWRDQRDKIRAIIGLPTVRGVLRAARAAKRALLEAATEAAERIRNHVRENWIWIPEEVRDDSSEAADVALRLLMEARQGRPIAFSKTGPLCRESALVLSHAILQSRSNGRRFARWPLRDIDKN